MGGPPAGKLNGLVTSTAASSSATGASATGEAGRVLIGGSVGCGRGVTAAVASFVTLKSTERRGTA